MAARERLLRELGRAIADRRVLDAIAAVPRDLFVPEDQRHRAWVNRPLPIGEEQTISQPLVVARMCELLELAGGERVLEIGTGSGYHAAVLAQLVDHVWSIERRPALSAQARANLDAAGVDNVTLVVGDGTDGLAEHAPYDAISVAAAASASLHALEQQLAAGGRLIAPIGAPAQRLELVRRTRGGLERQVLDPVRFVPLLPGVAPEP